MQNQMTHRPLSFVLIPVPCETIADASIEIGKPLQFTSEKGKITMEQIDPEEIDFVCDGNCELCPMIRLDCAGDCEVCPCRDNCNESEVF